MQQMSYNSISFKTSQVVSQTHLETCKNVVVTRKYIEQIDRWKQTKIAHGGINCSLERNAIQTDVSSLRINPNREDLT